MLVANVPADVGWNRTTTVAVAFAASEKGLPETIRYGAPTLALPDRDAPLTFCTVKLRSTVVPVFAEPKLTVVVGVTVTSALATPLAVPEHALSLPLRSTAVTRAK